MLTQADIQSCCTKAVFDRGKAIHERGGFYEYEEGYGGRSGRVVARAYVSGSHYEEYHTSLTIDEKAGFVVDWECECRAYFEYDGMCKHCVAVGLEYLERNAVPTLSRRGSSFAIDQLIYTYATDNGAVMQPSGAKNIEIVPEIIAEMDGGALMESLSLRVGARKKYVVKNIGDFLHAFAYGENVRYGKELEFVHREEALTAHSREVLAFVRDVAATQNAGVAQRGGWDAKVKVGREMLLAQQNMCDFYDLMMGRSFMLTDKGYGPYSSTKRTLTVQVKEGDPAFPCTLVKRPSGGYDLELPDDFSYCHRGSQLYVRLGQEAWRCSEAYGRDMIPFFLCVGDRLPAVFNAPLVVADDDVRGFCAAVLPALRERALLSEPAELAQMAPPPPAFSFYLDKRDGLITCTPNVAYDEASYNLCKPIVQDQLFRDLRSEGKVMGEIGRFFAAVLPDQSGLCFPADDLDMLADLLDAGTEVMALLGDVYLSDALQRTRYRPAPAVEMGVALESGLLNIKVSAEGIDLGEMRACLDSLRLRRTYHRLKSGDIVKVAGSGLEVLADALDGLGVGDEALEEGSFSVPAYRAIYLNQEMRDAPGVSFSRNKAFRELMVAFEEFDEDDYPIPQELEGILRPYQVIGFRWLSMLGRLGFGGVLADDMGLGKTLQAIAFILAEKHAGRLGTALIVCPTSLVYNWAGEIERFAPALDAVPVAGSKAERTAAIAHWEDHDVLITSYDLLRRDISDYAGIPFGCMFADEAQYIKNASTKNAKAVKRIAAAARFALTGTPIENRLSELWSIFDYLMPGFLGTHPDFSRRYEKPICAGKDEQAAGEAQRRLQLTIKPFVLRRLKAEVLSDLPEKNEIAIRARMGDKQRRLYDAVATQLKLTLEKQLPEEFQRGRIAVLAELTKLRQICCDPHLTYENYDGGSAKLDTCMELLEGAVEGGHKVLVFSQFTSMLDIIAAELSARGLACHLLTGSTPKKTRAELIRSFATDDVPVFLISLKAGGTGLNLTAADIVIHFDPWWNVAAQNQATDRAHRIGQDKNVSVFKIIAENSIEERIVELQDAKRDLAERVLEGEGMGAATLTREDLMALL